MTPVEQLFIAFAALVSSIATAISAVLINRARRVDKKMTVLSNKLTDTNAKLDATIEALNARRHKRKRGHDEQL